MCVCVCLYKDLALNSPQAFKTQPNQINRNWRFSEIESPNMRETQKLLRFDNTGIRTILVVMISECWLFPSAFHPQQYHQVEFGYRSFFTQLEPTGLDRGLPTDQVAS